MEIATEENEQAVALVYKRTLDALIANQSISADERLVHDVEHLMQEANSGASYEQYFRWASISKIATIAANLRFLGLNDVAELTEQAITVAFPNGIPETDEAKEDETDWTSQQEDRLSELFRQLEQQNGRVTNVLGAYARRVGI